MKAKCSSPPAQTNVASSMNQKFQTTQNHKHQKYTSHLLKPSKITLQVPKHNCNIRHLGAETCTIVNIALNLLLQSCTILYQPSKHSTSRSSVNLYVPNKRLYKLTCGAPKNHKHSNHKNHNKLQRSSLAFSNSVK